MAKKVALGKGIASLIQTPVSSSMANQYLQKETQKTLEENQSPWMVNIDDITPNPNQPRKIFKNKDLEELAASIKINGIIQPLIVSKKEKGFELIAGERRLRAAKKVGLKQVPVVVKRATERDKTIMAILENVQRSDLNCVEEALAYFNLINDFKLTQEEVAKRLGKERSSVANFLRILKLPRTTLELVQHEKLSFGHAKLLVGVSERETLISLGKQAAEENLSVRDLEKLIKQSKGTKRVPTKKEDNKKLLRELDALKQKLEQRTGFHFEMKPKKKDGTGQIVINYTSKEEFNNIYEYLQSGKS